MTKVLIQVEKTLNGGLLIVRRLEENSDDLNESQEGSYKKFVDRTVKVNKDIFILSLLLDEQMCGYDLIKEIFMKSNVFLNQGAVYPILYSLEEEGILQAEFSKGDMRTKRYSLTPEGRIVAQRKLDEFANAIEYVSALIKR
jgi:PadR family transcriptional regulator PadR